MKSARQARIVEILSDTEICTQQEITEMLQGEGFKVTQATVSRDLKELNLKKDVTSSGKHKYKTRPLGELTDNDRLKSTMFESITEINYSMNNVVVKTVPGLAQALASSIDNHTIDGVLGCGAGDDTIIIVTYDAECSERIVEKIKELGKIN